MFVGAAGALTCEDSQKNTTHSCAPNEYCAAAVSQGKCKNQSVVSSCHLPFLNKISSLQCLLCTSFSLTFTNCTLISQAAQEISSPNHVWHPPSAIQSIRCFRSTLASITSLPWLSAAKQTAATVMM